MDKKFRCSIVVFAGDVTKLNNTYDSIKSSSNADNIQIIIVDITGLNDTSLDRMKKDNCTVWLTGRSDYVESLKNSINGRFVTFIKAGITYDKHTLNRILGYAEKTNKEIMISKVRVEAKYNRIIKEHNAFCNSLHKGEGLDANHKLLHVLYFAYFFKTETLCWIDEIHADIWYFDLIRLVFNNIVKNRSLATVKSQFVFCESGAEAIADWSSVIGEAEYIDDYVERFLMKMLDIYNRDSIINQKNADYVLLYYFVRLKGALTKLTEHERFSQYNDFFIQFISGFKNTEVVILNQYISRWQKYFMLKNYFDDSYKDISEELSEAADEILNSYRVRLLFFTVKNGNIHMEYSLEEAYDCHRNIYLKCGNGIQKADNSFQFREIMWGNDVIVHQNIFVFDLAIEAVGDFIQAVFDEQGQMPVEDIAYTKYTPFSVAVSFFIKAGGKLIYLKNGLIKLEDETGGILFKRKCARTWSMIKRGKAGIKALIARNMYNRRKRASENIWLVSDRTNRGDDNGEVFFQYLCDNPIEGVKPYFVIDKDTEEWKKIGKYGELIVPFSREHKMKHLLSEFVISSQANDAVINPFKRYEYLYRDIMYHKPVVFLQHGVIKDDLSGWLNRYNRNLYGFVTTTKPEYESILNYDYYYTPDDVWLTGLPRHDKLYHDEKKYITVMPTWRKTLTAGTDDKGVWLLGEEFTDSNYYKFYDALLNHKRLLAEMKKRGYTLCFMPHPNAMSGIALFHHNPDVIFFDESAIYRDVFAWTNLMVTDYSSVAFDFAYLRKPIIYAQFDRAEFFNGEHSYVEGYYNYLTDGFGEVESELEKVVDRIIEYMDRDCELKPEYLTRINNTFAFSDKDCSKRVVDKMMKYRNGK